MHIVSLIFSLLFLLQFTGGALLFSNTAPSTLIVTYQTDEKGKERIDRIRFWLKSENQKSAFYPKGSGFSDKEHLTRKVVIEDLAPGHYTLEFLVPNKDGLFAEVSPRTFDLAPGTLLKINQEIKLRPPLKKEETAVSLTTPIEAPSLTPKLVIIRHGEADHNISSVFNSEMDHPNYQPSHLTEKGKEQVHKTAQQLLLQGINKQTVALVLVSPFPRTLETAAILENEGVFAHEILFIDSRLRELRMGMKEGTSTHLPHDYHQAHSYGGETLEEEEKRVEDLLNDLKKQKINGHVLLITHRHPAQHIFDKMTGESRKLTTAEAVVFPLEKLSPL